MRKRCKHWVGRRALQLKAAYHEMDSPFVPCREEDDYQKGLAVLLVKVLRRPEVQSVVAADLLALLKALSHV